jgi:CheY-like chemotaxis protein
LATTLLAVDDSKTMRKVIEITFTGEDFRLLVCGSADEALAKLGEKPSVALLDAGLEGTSGYELCRKLKAAQPGLQVIILSNKQQPFDRSLGGQVGADDFADKPFDTQQLLDKVNALAKKANAGVAAPAPAPAPVAAAPANPRSTTLSYGANPVPGGIPSAPAPAPAPSAAPMPSRQPTAPGMPAGPAAFASRAPTMLAASAPAEIARAAVAAPAAPAAVVASAVATNGADFAQKLGALGLSQEQVQGVLSLSREVVERVVWEVVPTLAETIIREEIQRLVKE